MSACTFFGHRECYDPDTERLKNAITDLIERGVDTFYVGHQGQFDAAVYRCLTALRKIHPHIRVCVVLAYLPRETPLFADRSDTMYPPIEGHPKFAIARRNRWMIGQAEYCVCYLQQRWGGAYQSAQLAKRRGLEMIYLGCLKSI